MNRGIDALVALTLLGVAIWQCAIGNWPAAIFFAILWHGFTNNTNIIKTNATLAGVRR